MFCPEKVQSEWFVTRLWLAQVGWWVNFNYCNYLQSQCWKLSLSTTLKNYEIYVTVWFHCFFSDFVSLHLYVWGGSYPLFPSALWLASLYDPAGLKQPQTMNHWSEHQNQQVRKATNFYVDVSGVKNLTKMISSHLSLTWKDTFIQVNRIRKISLIDWSYSETKSHFFWLDW